MGRFRGSCRASRRRRPISTPPQRKQGARWPIAWDRDPRRPKSSGRRVPQIRLIGVGRFRLPPGFPSGCGWEIGPTALQEGWFSPSRWEQRGPPPFPGSGKATRLKVSSCFRIPRSRPEARAHGAFSLVQAVWGNVSQRRRPRKGPRRMPGPRQASMRRPNRSR